MLSSPGAKPARLRSLCRGVSVRGAWAVLCCGAGQRQFRLEREMAGGKVGSIVELLQACPQPRARD